MEYYEVHYGRGMDIIFLTQFSERLMKCYPVRSAIEDFFKYIVSILNIKHVLTYHVHVA